MPEGPEIYCSTEFLRNKFAGEQVTSILFSKNCRYSDKLPKNYENFIADLDGSKTFLTHVKSKGKLQTLLFFNQRKMEPVYVSVTAGMTGFWALMPKNPSHVAWQINFASGKIIFFEDQRHFATISFDDKNAYEARVNKLGLNFLDYPNSVYASHHSLLNRHVEFYSLILKCDQELCQFLMRQDLVCGVGNYIKAESLYRAKLNPHRIANSLNLQESDNLCDEIMNVMLESISLGGASIRDYHQIDGRSGSFSDKFLVYGKKTTHWATQSYVKKQLTRERLGGCRQSKNDI